MTKKILIFIIFFIIFQNISALPANEKKVIVKKYKLGDGYFIFEDSDKNSTGSILLLTQIYCERNSLDFLYLYEKAYPGADTSWISGLKKNYGPYTEVPDKINVDLLIGELYSIDYIPLANEIYYTVYGEEYEGDYPNSETGIKWYIYIYIIPSVIAILLLLRYKERLRWIWRGLRKKSYDLETVEGCCKALEDKDQVVRSAAVEALGKIGNDHALDALIKALDDIDVWIKKAAILELGRLKSKRAVPHLIKSLDDKTGFIVSASAHSLAIIGDRNTIDVLKEKVKEVKSTATARDLRNAIQKLEKKYGKK